MEAHIKIIMFLTLAHYLADYPLQGEFLGTMKGKLKYLMFCHCLIWTGVVCVALEVCGLFEWWKLVFLFIGHISMDTWKARHPEARALGLTYLLWIDQTFHFFQIVVVALGPLPTAKWIGGW